MERVDCLDVWQEPDNERALPHLAHVFDVDEPRFSALVDLLKHESIEWSERIEHIYTDGELRRFPLLNLTVDRKPLEAGGPEYGTTYDLSASCPRCGSGAKQTSALMLPLAGLPKSGMLCEAAHGEILVAATLANALREAKLSALELRQARFYRNNEPLPWWQMISTYQMPPMSEATEGVIRSERLPPCPHCQRDGHYNSATRPTQIAYDVCVVDPEALPDVVETWERFGRSNIDQDFRFSHLGEPLILVSPKVLDVFRRLKIKGARFQPVRFV
jgi:hypothetical protein